MIGRTVSHYQLIEKLGEGGMGVVYKAEDTRLSRHVALKFLPPQFTSDPTAKARFVNEARAASALNHSNITVIHEIGETPDGQMFIVMAYYDGGALRDVLARGPLTVEKAVDVARQIASGLSKAHEKGIVHRDIKPANILITAEGEAKVADFGLAKLLGESRVTRTGTTVGTVHYMSPEQARGDVVDARSDVFSLGVVLYEMLAGRPPFRGDHEAAILYSIVNADPAPFTDGERIPTDLARIVIRALAKEPEDRYQSMRELIADLDSFHSGATIAAPRPSRRGWRGRLAIASLVIAVVAASVWFGARSRNAPASADEKSVAVFYFRNVSADPALDWMQDGIPEMLNAALSRSPELSVLDRPRIFQILHEMGGDAALGVDATSAMEVARRASVGTMIVGDILKSGSTIRVQSRIVDATSGRILRSDFVDGVGDDDVFKMVAELTDHIQTYLQIRALGESVDEEWIRDITSRSVDAYRHYVRGRSLLIQSEYAGARTELEAAIAVDSNFVMAYVDLTGACFNLEDYRCIGSAYASAQRLRSRASPKEQLYIDLIGAIIGDDSDRQITIASELLRDDPEGRFWRYALGRGYYMKGQYEESVRHWQPLYETRWEWIWTYLYMSRALLELKRYDESLAVLETAFEITPSERTHARAHLHFRRGCVQRERRDYASAIADFDRSESLDPTLVDVKYERGVLYRQKGEPATAKRLFEEYLASEGAKNNEVEAKAALEEINHEMNK